MAAEARAAAQKAKERRTAGQRDPSDAYAPHTDKSRAKAEADEAQMHARWKQPGQHRGQGHPVLARASEAPKGNSTAAIGRPNKTNAMQMAAGNPNPAGFGIASAKGVEIVDAKGNTLGEFDEINKGQFIEDKSAKGLKGNKRPEVQDRLESARCTICYRSSASTLEGQVSRLDILSRIWFIANYRRKEKLMSVSLLITEQGNRSERIVPIATEEIFIRYWKPLSSALDLQWVPLFQSGFFVDHTDAPLVLAELKKVSHYLSTRHTDDMPADVREHIASRVTKLISELEHSQDAVEVYIG